MRRLARPAVQAVAAAAIVTGWPMIGPATDGASSAPAALQVPRPNTPPAAPAGAARLEAIPPGDVTIADGFWAPRMEANRKATIPHIMTQNEMTGRVLNFAKAGGTAEGPYEGRRFNDTDVYKAIEAASYTLARHPDPALDAALDRLIALIAAAQEKDGYLFPARTVNPREPAPGSGPERWVHLNGSHELYNAGHLYEAAVAHAQATGKRTLLDVARKNADLLTRTFGPNARRAAPGHEEVELALVRLWRFTGEQRYLDLARFFLDQRGRPHDTRPYPDPGPFAMYNGREYKQDHVPVVEQARAVGHAVRFTYLMAAVSDVAAVQGDAAYARASERLFDDVVSKRLYVTGGLGSRGTTEAFGEDYELPNASAYTETCASIGGLLWYWREFLRTGDGRFLDVFERTLYNGYLSGVSLTGDRFFYQNPLESSGKRGRSAYFDVACCPANLARLMAQLPGLVYARRQDEVAVALYVGGRVHTTIGTDVLDLQQDTRYPWEGSVVLRVASAPATALTLALRVPGWAREAPVPSDLYRFADDPAPAVKLLVNEEEVPVTIDRGFVRLRRVWRTGDRIRLELPMPVRRLKAHPRLTEHAGKLALQRGPLVYCLEGPDNGGRVLDLVLAPDTALTPSFRNDLLNGVVAIAGRARVRASTPGVPAGRDVVAIPYFAWANRAPGEMLVWVASE